MSRKVNTALAAALLISQCFAAFGAPKLPSGPAGKGRFGAYYTTLKYSPEWDAQWRVGNKADVVVRFDEYDYRLVFWRGTNFMPFWVNECGMWSSQGSVERSDATPKFDKQCKYCFASVIESNDARAVVRWRYALLNKDGLLINTDPLTHWNDWVDEYYYIYPDAVVVRNVKLYSSDLKSPIISNRRTYLVDPRITHGIPGSSEMSTIFSGKDVKSGSADNIFESWPVLGESDGIEKTASLVYTVDPYGQDKTSKSWLFMSTLKKRNERIMNLTNSWLAAPKLTAAGCNSSGYDQTQRAYQLNCEKATAAVQLKLDASEGYPVYNPAFVIKGWGKRDISLSIDGKPIKRGPDFRYGFRKTETVSDLIVWVKCESQKPITIEIRINLVGGVM